MKPDSFYRKHENSVIAAGLVGLLFLFTALHYDFTYDLNDDVLMKDILSGAYTGMPESRNMQMLYPLSLLISLLYRLFTNGPVYGIFLCLCQFGSFFLIARRSLSFRDSTGAKLFMALFEGIIIIGLFLRHLVFIQYTVTAALLAATAAFLFLTGERPSGTRAFVRKNLLSMALAVLSFYLRSEMLLLLLPLIGAAGVMKWSEESRVFSPENLAKYLAVFGGICAGLLVGYALDAAAYGGADWKEFRNFFDSRTQLYDYQGIPPYEGNEELYASLGIGRSGQRLLLERYDFGMEEKVDAQLLDAIVSYQKENGKKERPFSARLKESAVNYIYRTLHREAPPGSEDTDYPWNLMVILGYITVFLIGIWNAIAHGKKMSSGAAGVGFKLILCGCVRTALWMFILFRNRYPVRITHSLYLMEACILFGLMLTEYAGVERKMEGRIKAAVVFPLMLCFTALLTAPESIAGTDREYEDRETAAVTEQSVRDYCGSHPDNFYFRDVYGAVSETLPSGRTAPYSEKLFKGVDNRLTNYDLMGGWLVKSPLHEKKLKQFGIRSMKEALTDGEKVFLLAETAAGTDWLSEYYEEQGVSVSIERIHSINGRIGVYRLTEDS